MNQELGQDLGQVPTNAASIDIISQPPPHHHRHDITQEEALLRREKIQRALEDKLQLSPVQLAALTQLYLQPEGFPTQSSVARHLHRTREAIRQNELNGLRNTEAFLKMGPEEYERVRRQGENSRSILTNLLWAQNLTPKKVADRLGWSLDTVYRTMKRLNIPSGKNTTLVGKLGENPQDTLTDLYWFQNLNRQEIADIFRVTTVTVSNTMRRLLIPIRKTSRKQPK